MVIFFGTYFWVYICWVSRCQQQTVGFERNIRCHRIVQVQPKSNNVATKTQAKAQAVPESAPAPPGQGKISMNAEHFPAARQYALPSVIGAGAPSTAYNDNMSLPSSIAPPKTGVAYIDKYELRYGAGYQSAEEATCLTSAALCLLFLNFIEVETSCLFSSIWCPQKHTKNNHRDLYPV
jgi:hypothetical protein